MGEAGRVVAIEPAERNCRLMHRSVVQRIRSVQLYPFAVWDRRGALAYVAQGSNGTKGFMDAMDPTSLREGASFRRRPSTISSRGSIGST